ncbi:MAG: ATP synthase subunit I [Pseudomonadota bacterium]
MAEDSPRQLVIAVSRKALLMTLAASLILVAVGRAPWAKGLALGGLVSVANFALMAWLLPRSLGAGRRKAEGWSLASLALRFLLMAGALGLSLSWPKELSAAACAAGLFMVQITLLLDRLVLARWREATWGAIERWKT